MIDFRRLPFFIQFYRVIDMPEYVKRLCDCGMPIEEAYLVCDKYEDDNDGLDRYVTLFETVHEIVCSCVD